MIYFDEAGNSGDNLLDKNQPVYVLLSHDFTDDEVAGILAPVLKLSKAEELHFKRLKKYEKSRKAIIEVISHPLIRKERVFHYVAHKEFMIVIQMVDKLVEEVFYRNGIDIYKGGLNISTANILYIMGKNVWDKNLFATMCDKFVVWMRSGEKDDGIKFYASVHRLQDTLKHEKDRALFSIIYESIQYANEIISGLTKYTLDATLSCFNAHCHFWAERYKKPFDITLDDSKQIEYWTDMIKFLTDSLPEGEVGFGSRKHKYPLLINSLAMRRSHTSLSLQLADILCSSLNYCYGFISQNKSDDFGLAIDNILVPRLSRTVMWPGKEMTPEELDMTDEEGVNPLDFIANAAKKFPDAFDNVVKPYRRKSHKR